MARRKKAGKKSGESPTKKPKLESVEEPALKMEQSPGPAGDKACSSSQVEPGLKGFIPEKVLNESIHRKMITVLGRYSPEHSLNGGDGASEKAGVDEQAIVVLERSALNLDMVKKMCESEDTTLTTLIANNIYRTFQVTGPAHCNELKMNSVFPATKSHIDKYSMHVSFILKETPEDYKVVTLPWLTEASFNIEWVYNILSHKKESESIVFEDEDTTNGFIMVPDFKWDRKSADSLYCLAICHQHGIKSLRDLTPEHLLLLKNIRDKGTAAVMEKYGLQENELRVYFHYQPSYYHLHVHFTNLKFEAPGTHALKAHLLSDVIDNIQLMPDFYQKKTIPFILQEGTTLYEKYKEAGRV